MVTILERWTPTGSWRIFAKVQVMLRAEEIRRTAERLAKPEWPDYKTRIETEG